MSVAACPYEKNLIPQSAYLRRICIDALTSWRCGPASVYWAPTPPTLFPLPQWSAHSRDT